jgi:hypothetical protein
MLSPRGVRSRRTLRQRWTPTSPGTGRMPSIGTMAPLVHGLVADRDRTRYRGLAEVHVSLRNPQVELVPCRRHQIVAALVDTSKTMEGGTST